MESRGEEKRSLEQRDLSIRARYFTLCLEKGGLRLVLLNLQMEEERGKRAVFGLVAKTYWQLEYTIVRGEREKRGK